jgi:hypothetical protein
VFGRGIEAFAGSFGSAGAWCLCWFLSSEFLITRLDFYNDFGSRRPATRLCIAENVAVDPHLILNPFSPLNEVRD